MTRMEEWKQWYGGMEAVVWRRVKAAECMHSCACCHQPSMSQRLEACGVDEAATRAWMRQLLERG
jgi:hypothetical protein